MGERPWDLNKIEITLSSVIMIVLSGGRIYLDQILQKGDSRYGQRRRFTRRRRSFRRQIFRRTFRRRIRRRTGSGQRSRRSRLRRSAAGRSALRRIPFRPPFWRSPQEMGRSDLPRRRMGRSRKKGRIRLFRSDPDHHPSSVFQFFHPEFRLRPKYTGGRRIPHGADCRDRD